ncbi:unnamed protein product [[Actinomadura] parvosata subsp. kistnae]|uniref:AAA+ ATPase domain-containing protein n=1 Tax=[Actinomadura] parvosata subsp. kistnae TaxID=1909395 RepID=A0A1V0A4S7_9ACTN|nr:hypothetical protein [Nonomuraea sp. ATCC 55076]AQZ65201.1 hypothetical protein BKM31_30500 [Nonomuraea sp. ATCC 55076]SPL96497.1 unnamed protein product [Actinomadura parvosata subsp. kistnae]
MILCPICLHEFAWSEDELYERTPAGQYQPLHLDSVSGPRREDLLRAAHVRCPAPLSDPGLEHHLPYTYVRHGRPLVIGLVGGPETGKTHLLASMIGAIEQGGLRPYGLTTDAVDIERHAEYVNSYVRPLLVERVALNRTTHRATAEPVDALLVNDGQHTTAVAFFDIAGELLRSATHEATRFVPAIGGLLFVIDAATKSARMGDESFRAVLDRLPKTGGRLDIPAAIAVTKSDAVRFQAPVDTWLYAEPDRLDPAAVLRESRDVYAYLHRRGAQAWLSPYDKCRKCTLHFVSATGAAATEGRYRRGVRPRRVLEPLISLFAMTGVLRGYPEVGL